MRFVFWQNIASHHQLAFLRELAKTAEVCLYVDRMLSPERRDQGWPPPSTEPFEIKIVSPQDIPGLVDAAGSEALHVFAPRGCLSAPILLRLAQQRPLRFAFMAEKPDGGRLGLFFRAWLYRLLALSTRPEVFLAMGESGAEWYRGVGFRAVYPFGYSVTDSANSVESTTSVAEVGFIFIARLVPRKRPEDFVRALACLPRSGWRATVVGEGPLRPSVRALADELGLAGQIRWIASLPNAEIRTEIARHDALILCSEWEGWGAVVNEAFAEGSRVVVSDACGASCLLRLGDIGESFSAGDVGDLVQSLHRQLVRGAVGLGERTARRELYHRINPAAFAAYFSDLLRGRPVAPPWTPSSP